MKRRDTETTHEYANEIFSQLKIYDIQGLLREGEKFNCGVEAYQVNDFDNINFNNLKQLDEIARYKFCNQLGIPYLVIITSEKSGNYQIFKTVLHDDKITFELLYKFTSKEFIEWWRQQQSFEQKKAMFNAAARIEQSIIDKDLFANSLAWGVNIDGFSFDDVKGTLNAIYEKRIGTYSEKYSILNYDPNVFFHYRGGDFGSWNILFELSKAIKSSLILFTFDNSKSRRIGVTKIIDVNQKNGLTYLNSIKPFQQIIKDDLEGLRLKINSML
jgi:hypothetical protein